MIDEGMVFTIAAAILLIGFVGNSLFKKTGLPDIIFLIFLGLLFGPVLRVFSWESLRPVSPYLTTLTFMMVLFNGGLKMDLSKVFAYSGRALILALSYLILVTAGVSALAHVALGLDWVSSLMFGPMIAGTSSVVVMPLAARLRLREDVTITLSLESVVTDALNVVFLFALVEARVGGFLDLREVGYTLIQKFSTGMVIGSIVGIAWLRVLRLIRREEFVYMSTLAILLASFEVSELVGGSGILTALVFGIVLGNEERINQFLGDKGGGALDEVKATVARFQGEMSFLMKTFFFFFLGLIYNPGLFPVWLGLLYASAILAVNLALRHVAVRLSTVRSGMRGESGAMTLMCGQGLAHAALSLVPMQLGLPNAHVYLPIVTNVILMTNLVTSAAAFYLKRLSEG